MIQPVDAAQPSDREANARPRVVRPGPFGVLDIGTTKIACLIARTDQDGVLRATGFGWQRGRGVKSGGISDLDEAERAIRAAVGQAENMAEQRLGNVTVNLGCGQPESRQVNMTWPIGGRTVEPADLLRVMHEGRTRAQVENRTLVYCQPLGFQVDDMSGVSDPRGLYCDQLTARLHVVDGTISPLRNLQATVNRCDLDMSEMVPSPIAAGLSVLTEDERDLGTTVIDMGGSVTGIALFVEGQAVFTSQLMVGGGHVTNDIARGLSTTAAAAERMKTLYGNIEPCSDDAHELLTVPMVGEEDRDYRSVPRSTLISIIKPRLEETFEMVRDALDAADTLRAAGSRVVLTGGASQLVGVQHMAARVLGRQVRLGRPQPIRGLPEQAMSPAFAALTGLLHWSAGEGRCLPDIDMASDPPTGLIRRLVAFFKDRV